MELAWVLLLFLLVKDNLQGHFVQEGGKYLSSCLAKVPIRQGEESWRRVLRWTTSTTFFFRATLVMIGCAYLVKAMERHIVAGVEQQTAAAASVRKEAATAAEGDWRRYQDSLPSLAKELGLEEELDEMLYGSGRHKLPPRPSLPELPLLDFVAAHNFQIDAVVFGMMTVVLLPFNMLMLAMERRYVAMQAAELREARVGLLAGRKAVLEARERLCERAWGVLSPSGTHPSRLPWLPLGGKGIVIGREGAPALSAFALQSGLLAFSIPDKHLEEVHCVIMRDPDSSEIRVVGAGNNRIRRNGFYLQNEETLLFGDELGLRCCAAPLVDVSYRVVGSEDFDFAVGRETLSEASVVPEDTALNDLVGKALAEQRNEVVRQHWCCYFASSIPMLLIAAYIGMCTMTDAVGTTNWEYMLAFHALYQRRQAGNKGGKGQSTEESSKFDLAMSEKIISPWSMLFLICACLVIPLLLGLVGLIVVNAWGRAEIRKARYAAEVNVSARLDALAKIDAVMLKKQKEEVESLLMVMLATAAAEASRNAPKEEAMETPPSSSLPPRGSFRSAATRCLEEFGAASEQQNRQTRTSSSTSLEELNLEDFSCPICLGPCRVCVALLPCGHNLCASCCQEHLQRLSQPRCPYNCQVERVVPNHLARGMIASLQRKHKQPVDTQDPPEFAAGGQVTSEMLQLPADGRPASELCQRSLFRRARQDFF
eukprot:TRINITY_DN18160_c0_g1_i2.p1 TRINITY_DN18160_c0_g1~~TRINITY_DN18160_c0_g1_i2.p1  ORF type:complete len:710 (-),score=179.66 TRINITY_DN18160_c0_g1_i2:586-2715(-)